MNNLPQWAIDEIKARIDEKWIAVRKDLTNRLGWKPTAEMIYDVIHDISPADKQTACGKGKTFINHNRGYVFCGSFTNCPCSVMEAKNTRGQTNLSLYGNANFFLSAGFEEKKQTTCMETFGVSHYVQTDEFKQKSSVTCQERYGVAHISHSEEIQTKIQSTNKDRYGGCGMASPELREKFEITMMERYGTTHALLVPDIKEKAEETALRNHGYRTALESPAIRELIRSNNLERYGTEFAVQRHIPREALEILNDPERLHCMVKESSFRTLADLWGIDSSIITRHWKRHGFHLPLSVYEDEIAHFLTTLGVTFVANRKHKGAGVSLDFFLPEYKFGIEFNGLYWHSTARRPNPDYHREKYQACRNAGIDLLMINEDVWLERSLAIKNLIRGILLPIDGLDIQQIKPDVAKTFPTITDLNITHALGGYLGDDLVTVMAFRGNELVQFGPDSFNEMLNHAIGKFNLTEITCKLDLRYGLERFLDRFVPIADHDPEFRYVHNRATSLEPSRYRIYDCGSRDYIRRSDY